jgi:hypothetical protein
MTKTLKNLRQSVEATAGAAAAAVIEPMSQKLAQTSFLANVKSDVGLILRARSPLTLEEATQIASEEEQIQKSKANSYSSSRYSPPQIARISRIFQILHLHAQLILNPT